MLKKISKWLYPFLRKMGFVEETKLNFEDFKQKVHEIAKGQNSDSSYYSINIEYEYYGDNIKLSAYTPISGWESGYTVNEVIDKLRNGNKPKGEIKEVIF